MELTSHFMSSKYKLVSLEFRRVKVTQETLIIPPDVNAGPSLVDAYCVDPTHLELEDKLHKSDFTQ